MMFSISDLRRRSSLTFASSKLGRMQPRLHSNTSEQADQARGRPETIALFPASATKRAMSTSFIERPHSVGVPGVLPELTFNDFSCDPNTISQATDKHGQDSLRVKLGQRLLKRPTLTSRSTSHIANQLNISTLSEGSSASVSVAGTEGPEDIPTSPPSPSLEQLVRDTENAFDAVSSALAEMKAMRASYSSVPSQPPTPPPKDPARSLPPKSAVRPVRPPSLPRRKSAKSLNRTKSQKSNKSRTQAPRRKSTTASKASIKRSTRRWGIPGNVSDLFSMRMFQKIEADEVVTPVQIEAFKIRKMSLALVQEQEREKERSRASLESIFQYDDVASDYGPSLSTTPPPIDSPSSVYSTDEPELATQASAPAQYTQQDLARRLIGDEPGFTFLDDSTPSECTSPLFFPYGALPSLPSPPTPPAKNPRRSLIALNRMSALLPLPEDAEATVSVSSPRSTSSQASGDVVYLRSTPCTLTAPQFRHGPIRVSRRASIQENIMGFDDGLDWTAFQMAIQGGAGDWYSENEETTRRREADEVKDVVAWWKTWNFESAGELVSAERREAENTQLHSESSRSSIDSTHTIESSASLSDGSDDHDDYDEDELSDNMAAYSLSPSNPYSAHHKWRVQSGNTTSTEVRLEVDTAKQATPIEDGIQVVRNSSSDMDDFVPMGCNLTSDLGDFLRWEAEHAYAGNFYSGPSR